jgi:hypothetical protein
MVFSLLYLAVRALLGVLVRSRRGLDVKDIELMVLRHEFEVQRRQGGGRRFVTSTVLLLAAAVCHLPRSSRAALLVTPRTLLRWHRASGKPPARPAAAVGRDPGACAAARA